RAAGTPALAATESALAVALAVATALLMLALRLLGCGRSRSRIWRCHHDGKILELKTGLAGGIRQRRDLAVVEVAAAVEDHGADVGGLGALGDELADLGRGSDIRRRVLHRLVEGGGGDDRAARHVVDDLGVNVLVRVMHCQTGAL